MHEKKFEIIQELMSELQGLMEPGAEDFDERLGKPKAVAIEVASTDEEDPLEDEVDMEDPDEVLKERLMKLRG